MKEMIFKNGNFEGKGGMRMRLWDMAEKNRGYESLCLNAIRSHTTTFL
jgi:hypothetical protein